MICTKENMRDMMLAVWPIYENWIVVYIANSASDGEVKNLLIKADLAEDGWAGRNLLAKPI